MRCLGCTKGRKGRDGGLLLLLVVVMGRVRKQKDGSCSAGGGGGCRWGDLITMFIVKLCNNDGNIINNLFVMLPLQG